VILEIRNGNNTVGDLVNRSGLKTIDLVKEMKVDRTTILRWKKSKVDVCLDVYFKLVNYLNSIGKLFLDGEPTGFTLDTESKSLNSVKELFDINMIPMSNYADYIKATPISICKFCAKNKDPLKTKVSRYIDIFLFTSNNIASENNVNNFKVKILHDRIKGKRIKDINNNPYIKGTDANLKMMSRQGW